MRSNAKVTVVVVPRERFSYALPSLESLYKSAGAEFELIYVDGGSPRKLRNALRGKSRELGFRLIRTEHFLTPNEARNIGLAGVTTPFVVFADNDVYFTPHWLGALLECAEQTDAWITWPVHTWGPLSGSGPDLQTIHSTGGEAGFFRKDGIHGIYERTENSMKKLDDIRPSLVRRKTEIAEFHCVMIRSKAFQVIGKFDEGLKSTREHTDFCLRVREAGGSIFLEPHALVSYVTPPPLRLGDIGLYLFRWSEIWNDVSLAHINRKWGLDDDYASLRSNWLVPQRRVALRPMRRMAVSMLGQSTGDRLVDAAERLWARNAMRKRRKAGLDAELASFRSGATETVHAENS